MKCIKCGSGRVAPILYGMPAFSEELERKLNSQKLYLGDCCVTGADPKYHCFECKKNFGIPPILLSKKGQEDYRDIVTSICFSDGGFFGGYDIVEIKPDCNERLHKIQFENLNETELLRECPLTLQVSSGYGSDKPVFQRVITQTEWKKILNQLFCKLYIHEWKKSYTDDRILDGEQWELSITLTKGRHRNYYGSNAYPPLWEELKKLFRPFFAEAEIEY